MGHDLIDKRSLELNRFVVEKIRQHPELTDFVGSKLDRTLSESRPSNSYKDALREWQTILSGHPLNEILEILTQGPYEGQRLRQINPVFRSFKSTGMLGYFPPL